MNFSKHIHSTFLLIALLTSSLIEAQSKPTITIKGKLTVKDNGKPPLGVINVLEKDVADYLLDGDYIATNRHTYVQKDGTFSFKINKGGSIIITDNGNRYLPIRLNNLDKDQTLDLVVHRKDFSKRKFKGYPPNKLYPFEAKMDPSKIVKVSGKVVDAHNKPLKNIFVTNLNLVNQNASGKELAFVMDDKNGEFTTSVIKNGKLSISKLGYQSVQITPSKDTVVTIKLHLENPF